MNLLQINIGIAICTLCVGCYSYKLLDTTQINKIIEYDVSIQNPGEIMELYYPQTKQVGVLLNWNELHKPKHYEVAMVHFDSVKVLRLLMYTEFNGDTWYVSKIKQSYATKHIGILRWRGKYTEIHPIKNQRN